MGKPTFFSKCPLCGSDLIVLDYEEDMMMGRFECTDPYCKADITVKYPT